MTHRKYPSLPKHPWVSCSISRINIISNSVINEDLCVAKMWMLSKGSTIEDTLKLEVDLLTKEQSKWHDWEFRFVEATK
jgi:hypothetical protein